MNMLDLWRQVSFGLSAMADGHVVTCVDQLSHDIRANKACSADNKNAYGFFLRGLYANLTGRRDQQPKNIEALTRRPVRFLDWKSSLILKRDQGRKLMLELWIKLLVNIEQALIPFSIRGLWLKMFTDLRRLHRDGGGVR